MYKVIEDMPDEEYHATPHLSSSKLKVLVNQTPAHYYHKFLSGKSTNIPDNKNLIFGKASHTVILQPWDFDNQFCVLPEGVDRRSKVGKELWADIKASGKQPLSSTEFSSLVEMGNQVAKIPFWAKLLALKPKFELSLFDDDTKIRPDMYIEPCCLYPNGLIVDVKTTVDASKKGFGKTVHNFCYDVQGSFYKDFFNRNTKHEPEFMFLAIEKTKPYLIKFHRFDEATKFVGDTRMTKALELLRDCTELNNWYGYGSDVEDIELPSWAFDDVEDDILTGE
jgi:exodeoxyribonuclease VIII